MADLMSLLLKEIESVGGKHSEKNTPVEEMFDMIMDDYVKPVWHVQGGYCEWIATEKLKDENNKHFIVDSKAWSAYLDKFLAEREPRGMREACMGWMITGMLIIDDKNCLTLNRRDYPQLVEVILDLCEKQVNKK